MYFVIREGNKTPYEFFQFASLKQAHEAEIVNDFSIVYKELGQLEENYSKQELDAIWRSMNLSSSDPLWSFKKGFPNKKVSASKLHEYVKKEAIIYQKEELVMAKTSKIEKAPKSPKAEKSAKTSSSPKIPDETSITVLIPEIGGRDGSHRKNNLKMIYESKTIGEAVETFIKNGSDRKTAMAFIRWANNQKMISLGE